ncbi:SusC/RagA family TonB-linked outer membrane protein [Mucilaginibacter sp. FT3.2]|uniref:SusC/RagA family TonB-linked outer membrane protein n=1 Tax=Mucilaginibacter sp. FT3.2 TaxID=2723090 RepID=UPI00161987A7|nr:TonB-dependent receptor [Mucilaginibacter sp. FT3.2]MBB6232874.1 TonB-linked SusC/RagA family outer membrane protein [Mucilaginibacter sp. FT3.2]
MAFIIQAHAQETLKITGTVKDELNMPLPGVSVKNQRSKKINITDVNGKYSIDAVRGDSLIVTYIGYRTYSTVIKDVINITISLQAAENSLNEVAIVGYGQQKKISLVGAQSTVNLEDIKQPVANLSATLAGRISGLVGVQRSGLPGQNGADLWIRGISTFNANNNASPLIIVDGVQGRDINGLDPEDISSFTILKDASATAVYGVSGANGVILINTKKGTNSKPVLMFNYNQGITSFTKTPELTDGIQYMMLRNEARLASGQTKEYSNNYINSTIQNADPNLYPNVDWMKALFNNTAQNRRANFSARGGSETATYYVSGAYYDEESLLKTDNLQSYDASTRFKRYNFTSNVSMNWTSTTKFDLGVQGYITNTNYPGVSPNSAFADVMQTNPVLYPVMYPGNLVPGVSSAGAQPNPYAEITQTGYSNIFSNQVLSNARLTQDLKFWVPGLTFSALYSFDVYNTHTINRTRTRSWYQINRSNPYNDDGSINLNVIQQGTDQLGFSPTGDANGTRQYYTEASLNYDKNIDKKNHITALALFNQREQLLNSATDLTGSLPYRSQGLAGRVTYSYDNKYFAEGNFGYNGSENFAPAKKFGFFPSFGVGWVISNEKFYEPLKGVIDFAKVRYSDGIVGDGGVQAGGTGRRFGYLTLVSTGASGYTFGNGTSAGNTGYGGTAITSYGTDVTWARSHKRDLGLEIQAFRSLFSLTVDFFNERRSGVFLDRASLPAIVGLSSQPTANLGIITNKGIDATVALNPTKIGAFTLDVRGTFTYNRDKVIENDQAPQPFPYMERRGTNYLATFGYVATGLFKNQAEIDAAPSQSALGTVRPGDIRYKDLNGDGKIDANDVTRIGNGDVPTTTYGIGFNLQYKNFYIGVFFQGVAGADRLLSGDGIIPFNNSTGAERSNLFEVAEDRWTPENPNPNAFYPRLAYGNSANKNNAVASSWWVKNIDFIRLKTADLGYNLPKGFLKNIGLKSSRVYMQGLNLLYWSPFKLWDPELNTSNGTAYPNIRTLTLGVQANF